MHAVVNEIVYNYPDHDDESMTSEGSAEMEGGAKG